MAISRQSAWPRAACYDGTMESNPYKSPETDSGPRKWTFNRSAAVILWSFALFIAVQVGTVLVRPELTTRYEENPSLWAIV